MLFHEKEEMILNIYQFRKINSDAQSKTLYSY